jgi:hypothetical protein
MLVVDVDVEVKNKSQFENGTTTEQKHLKGKIPSADHGEKAECIARRSRVDITAATALTRR